MTKFFCKAGYKKASICFFDFLSNTSPDNALRIKLSISSVLCSFLMMKMYVTHSKNSVPQIDFSTWKQQEAERAEAESLERLRCRYLKSTDNRAPNPAKENLTLFYEKVFNGYTSKLQINPSVPDAMQSALHRGLLAFTSQQRRLWQRRQTATKVLWTKQEKTLSTVPIVSPTFFG